MLDLDPEDLEQLIAGLGVLAQDPRQKSVYQLTKKLEHEMFLKTHKIGY